MRNIVKLMVGAALLLSGPALAQGFQEGQHYQRVGSPVAAPSDRIEVIDAFGYPCPACRRFLPYLEAWEEKQPDWVEFDHLPVALQPGWDLFARAYYTAKVMGIAEETHEAMFKALHDQRRQFRSFADIADFYADFGVDADSFVNTSRSFAVDANLRQNRNDVRTFGIRSTPSVIVQGKWVVSPNGFNSYDEMLAAVDYLVAREAEALGLTGDGAAEPAAAEKTGEAAR